jgi:hypothetical protein
VTRSFLALVGFASTVGLATCAAACASGGSSGGASTDGGGDDSTILDGAPVEGSTDHEGGTTDGGGTSFAQACSDNAAKYCAKLSTCSPFLLSTQYGDMPTCVTRLSGAYCNNIVTAKGSGWTGDGLEACVAARDALSCSDFLYLKPAPAACRPSGTLTSGSCLWDSQCGTGYCRITAGTGCGNCVQRGNTGAPCATSNDCDGNLVCAGAACAAPQPLGVACSATSPCESGLVCLFGKCAAPGAVGAACNLDAGGIDCDYNLGAYCSGGMCGAITVAMLSSLCGGSSPPAVCFADGACQAGFCVAPTADGQPCDAGLNCTIPSTCNAGVCTTPSATQCP